MLKNVGSLRMQQLQSRELSDNTHDDDDRDYEGGGGGGVGVGTDAVMVMTIEQSLLELTSQVVELLWELDPFEYFAMVMDGVENHALAPIADDDDDDNDEPDLDESMISKHFIPLMGHVAVIASLIEAYHSSSSSNSSSSRSHIADH